MLKLNGIRGVTFKLIQSYLTNRTQYVIYNSSLFKGSHVTIGFPQGSILGPLDLVQT